MNCKTHTLNRIKTEYKTVEKWNWKEYTGQNIATTHYLIHTTVNDPEKLQQLSLVLESAYREYQKIYPCQVSSVKPLEVYYFATYDQWAAYTVDRTREDSETYLSVFNGAYCIGDEFVCWDGNHGDTLQSASHEGFHQYVSRYFKTRLPPTLEEGIACMFENIRLDGSVAIIDMSHNIRRQTALRQMLDKAFLPMATILPIHAGDLANRGPQINELYYAQAWGLARMLQTSPKYQEKFAKMIADTATGHLPDPIGLNNQTMNYYPARVLPFFQRFFGENLQQFEDEYKVFLHELAMKSPDYQE